MEYTLSVSVFSIGDMEGGIRGSSFKVQIWCFAQGISIFLVVCETTSWTEVLEIRVDNETNQPNS